MGGQETPRQNQEDVSELEKKIIQQVEYYFGNYNLRRDKFLKEQIQLDDGWVPLEVMVKFNRLKSLSEDVTVIAGALKKAPNHLLEVSEDDTKIRRSLDQPVPEYSLEVKTDIASRTIYSKKFPAATTLDELLQFFKRFGKIETVTMKRKPNKSFKGSVFVTFTTKGEADNFLKLATVKYNNATLLNESKEAYLKRKELEFQQRQQAKEQRREKNEQNKRKESFEDQSESLEQEIVRGCVLKLSGLSESTMREHIMEVLDSDARIAYLDYSRGKPEAFVRFTEGVAESVLETYSKEEDDCKKITVNGVEAVAMVLTGDTETEYWQKLLKLRSERKQRPHFKKGRFNSKTAGKDRPRFGKRGRYQNDRPERGNKRTDESEESQSKMPEVEKEEKDKVTSERGDSEEPPRKMQKAEKEEKHSDSKVTSERDDSEEPPRKIQKVDKEENE